jgi:excisionase family DNA binding protein
MDYGKRDLLSIGDASIYLGVSIDTLRRWERRGRINPYRSPGGHRYYKRDELDQLFGRRYSHDEKSEIVSKDDTQDAIDQKEIEVKVEDNRVLKPVVEEMEIQKEVVHPSKEIKIPLAQVVTISRPVLPTPVHQHQIVETSPIAPPPPEIIPSSISQPEAAPKMTATILIPQVSLNKKENIDKQPIPQRPASKTSSKELTKTIVIISILVLVILLGIILFVMLWVSSRNVISPSP